MIERLLPPVAVAVEALADPPDATLFPQEEALIARAVDKRRREFTAVRACARAALSRLGLPPAPILPGRRGAPVWPAGVVGSMTHCDGYRAAAVARADRLTSVGIDAEPHQPLPDGVLDAISRPEEREHLRWLDARFAGVRWDRLLFSAKESVYKAWFPITGAPLDFAEASLTLDPAAGTFVARLLVQPPVVAGRPLTGFAGRFLVESGLVLTAIAEPPHDAG